MIEGGCLCGKVRYVVDGDIGQVSHCHCAMCRKIHGAAFGTYGAIRTDQFRWTAGEASVKSYRSSAIVERTFCEHCGSTLRCNYSTEPGVYYLTLGTVDGDPGCRPDIHIFTGSKAPWFEITDAVPQFDTWADGREDD